MFETFFYFIVALVLLVIVHEYGHFQVARWCGVKVLRFSFGFGPILARYRDKKGTEYVWSLIPLGGYVKMLDESEEEVAAEEKHLAFNNQSIVARMAVVLAGPLFNFIFAFCALWLVLVIGMHSLAPMIAAVKPGSIAANSGFHAQEEFIAVDGVPVHSWRDVQYAMMPFVGSKKTINVIVKSLHTGQEHSVALPLKNWHIDDMDSDPLDSLGIEPFIPKVPPIVAEVVPDSPAAAAGIQVNDALLRINEHSFDDWLYFVDYVRAHPNQKITLELMRAHQKHTINMVIGTHQQEGFIGVRSQKVDWPAHWLRTERETPLAALGVACKQTIDLTKTTFLLMGRLVTGTLSVHSISGPVGIAQGAGNSARGGFTSYLLFLALISVSLGALNLLPIPLLDGGHLLYYVLELIFRRPVPEAIKAVGVYVGLTFVVVLMAIALTNDISRLGS